MTRSRLGSRPSTENTSRVVCCRRVNGCLQPLGLYCKQQLASTAAELQSWHLLSNSWTRYQQKKHITYWLTGPVAFYVGIGIRGILSYNVRFLFQQRRFELQTHAGTPHEVTKVSIPVQSANWRNLETELLDVKQVGRSWRCLESASPLKNYRLSQLNQMKRISMNFLYKLPFGTALDIIYDATPCENIASPMPDLAALSTLASAEVLRVLPKPPSSQIEFKKKILLHIETCIYIYIHRDYIYTYIQQHWLPSNPLCWAACHAWHVPYTVDKTMWPQDRLQFSKHNEHPATKLSDCHQFSTSGCKRNP